MTDKTLCRNMKNMLLNLTRMCTSGNLGEVALNTITK